MNEIKTPDATDYEDMITALQLKIRAIEADIMYAADTHYCSDCPRRSDAGDLERVRYDCCRETGEFDDQFTGDEEYIHHLKAAIEALRQVLVIEGEA